MTGIKRVKWPEDDIPPEWEEQYRDVDSDFDADSDLNDPNSHASWIEEHSTRDITRERMAPAPFIPFEEYSDPEGPEDGNQDTNDWINVDIYKDLYPEEEVNQEKAAIRKKR